VNSPFPNGHINWLLIALAALTLIVLIYSGVFR